MHDKCITVLFTYLKSEGDCFAFVCICLFGLAGTVLCVLLFLLFEGKLYFTLFLHIFVSTHATVDVNGLVD